MQTTTPRRSLWSVLRAYRQIGRLRSRTGPLWISLVRLALPLTAIAYFLFFMPSPIAGMHVVLAALGAVYGAIGIDTMDVIVGWRRFQRTRPLVKLFDTEPVLEPMRGLRRSLPDVDDEELPLAAFAVMGNAATFKKMRSLLHLSPGEVGRALRLPARDVLALERGTKNTSDQEWGVVLRTVIRLGEEKEVRIAGVGGGLTNVDPFTEHAVEVSPSPLPEPPCAVGEGMVSAGHAPDDLVRLAVDHHKAEVARLRAEREQWEAKGETGCVGGRPLTPDEITTRGGS